MIMVRDWSSLPDMVKRWGAKGGVITRKRGQADSSEQVAQGEVELQVMVVQIYLKIKRGVVKVAKLYLSNQYISVHM